MFDKFGEFDSAEELNRAAAAQLKEGDEEAVIAIAVENGIDREEAEDYIDGCTEELVTPLMAALGKLEIEAKELHTDGLIDDWKEYIVQCCTEEEDICKAVRKKGKCLERCMGELLKFSFNAKKQVSDKIVQAAGLRTPIYLGVPSRTEAKKIIRSYYMG